MNFYEFDIPAQINGTQLKQELGCSEVYIRGDKLVIVGSLTQAQASSGLAAHVPVDLEAVAANKATAKAQILDRLGLTEEEVQLLLS